MPRHNNRRRKTGPDHRAGLRFRRTLSPALVYDEITEHGGVVAGPGADELVGSRRRRREGRLCALAWADEDGRAQYPRVIHWQPVIRLAGCGAVGGHGVFSARLDQRPVVGVDAGRVIEDHDNLGSRRCRHAIDVELQGIAVHADGDG